MLEILREHGYELEVRPGTVAGYDEDGEIGLEIRRVNQREVVEAYAYLLPKPRSEYEGETIDPSRIAIK
jgi:hypothetical protein